MAQHDSSLTVHLDPVGALAHTERVVGLLRVRRQEITSMSATFRDGGATLELSGPGGDACHPGSLLVRRLERLTGVLSVEVTVARPAVPAG